MLKGNKKNSENVSLKNPFGIFGEKNSKRLERVGKVKHGMEDIIDCYEQGQRSSDFLGKSLSHTRINYFIIFVVFCLILLISKTFYLQIINGENYHSLAERNRIKVDYIKTTRGLIYDRNGIVLVKNIPTFEVIIIPSELPFDKEKRNLLLSEIALIINESVDELHSVLDPIKPNSLYYYQPIVVKEDIQYEESILLAIESNSLPGVYVETSTYRKYLNENSKSLSHILGYVGKISESEFESTESNKYLLTDYTGKSGIEKTYEQDLRGAHGSIKHEVDAYGREKKILDYEEKYVGGNIVLSLDIKIQEKLEQILNEHLLKAEKSRGSIVALDPRNGEVLALVSLPSYDNNDFSRGITSAKYSKLLKNEDNPLFFRAIAGEYPSGSTFKLVMAAAALQEGNITENTSFLSNGGVRIGQWFFPDWKAGGHGRTNVIKALADSVNTFFYLIGGGYQSVDGIGLEKMVKYSKLFGLGSRLGIDLPQEATGFVPTEKWKNEVKEEPWYIGDTYHFAIGQGDLLVTPLQVATYTSAIANGGVVYRPKMVKDVINSNVNRIFKRDIEVLTSGFIDSKNIDIVRKGLRQGVTNGSARRLNYLPIEIAGKTGTAQWSRDGDPHAWFTSFAPYSDPEIVLTILVEEGEGGSRVAVPIAEDFYKWWGGQRE